MSLSLYLAQIHTYHSDYRRVSRQSISKMCARKGLENDTEGFEWELDVKCFILILKSVFTQFFCEQGWVTKLGANMAHVPI